MAWQTPKTTWAPTDYIMHTDWNRISSNMAYLHQKAEELIGERWHYVSPFTPYTAVSKGAMAYTFASEWNAVMYAIDPLWTYLLPAEQMLLFRFRDGGPTPTYTQLNDIESAQLRIHNTLANIESDGGVHLEAQLEGGFGWQYTMIGDL